MDVLSNPKHVLQILNKKETPYNRLIIRSLSGCPVGFEPTTFRTTI